jgi:hypothetical protein
MTKDELLDLAYKCLSHFSDGRADEFYPAFWEIDRFCAMLKQRRVELPDPFSTNEVEA